MDATTHKRLTVRGRVVFKYCGQLSLALAAFNLAPCCVAAMYDEWHAALRYIAVSVIFLIIGAGLRRINAPNDVHANESIVVVLATYLFACIINTYPIMLEGFGFLDSFLEVVSSITATGISTMSASNPHFSTSFYFDRAWMEWYGTLGVIAIGLSVLSHSAIFKKILGLSELEASGILEATRIYGKRVLKVFCGMTIIGVVGAWLLGLNLFDAVIYTFSAVTTGGFGTSDSSLVTLNPALQIWITVLCIVAALPFTIYYNFRHRNKLSRYYHVDLYQVKVFLGLTLVITLIVMACFYVKTHMNLTQILSQVTLLVTQMQTSTGFDTIPFAELDPGSKIFLIFSMLIGGCAGSTAGGIKVLRFIMFFSVIKGILANIVNGAPYLLKSNLKEVNLSEDDVTYALLFMLLFIGIIFFSWTAFIIYGYSPLDSLFAITSSIGTVGMSIDMINPGLPVTLKLVLCLDMLFGRFEVLAWLVVFYPGNWFRSNKPATALVS